MAKFGSYLKNLRKSHNLTLTQFAAKLNLDSANLSKIENGKREFDEKKLSLLVELFSLDYSELEAELISDKIAKKLYGYKNSIEILSLAESKVKYLKNSSKP